MTKPNNVRNSDKYLLVLLFAIITDTTRINNAIKWRQKLEFFKDKLDEYNVTFGAPQGSSRGSLPLYGLFTLICGGHTGRREIWTSSGMLSMINSLIDEGARKRKQLTHRKSYIHLLVDCLLDKWWSWRVFFYSSARNHQINYTSHLHMSYKTWQEIVRNDSFVFVLQFLWDATVFPLGTKIGVPLISL